MKSLYLMKRFEGSYRLFWGGTMMRGQLVNGILPASAAPQTVLVVDDDEAVTKTFERALIVGGYRVLTALSAHEARLSRRTPA
jgi:hypothetical protein